MTEKVFIGYDLQPLKDALGIQRKDGNWNSDPYMLGMYNGLEFALACLEGREPDYKSFPEDGFKHCFHSCKDSCRQILANRMLNVEPVAVETHD